MTLINGDAASELAADDRGLAYGDGVFETIAIVAGEPALWPAHYERLASGCRLLGFTPPTATCLYAEVRRVAGVGSGVVRITITRGSGGRGYRAPGAPEPRRIVTASPLPDYPIGHWQDGIAVRLCSTRLPYRPALAGHKHLNRLEQVLARSEWDDPAIPEGLMATPDDSAIAEGTMTNLFARFGDDLVTPPIRDYGVEGVMRGHIRAERERVGRTLREAPLALDDLVRADEVFVTNSLIGLWPVRDLAGKAVWEDWPWCREMLARLTGAAVMVDWLGERR
jgi:4-amino-4-deoxychorismate lyase